jgi:hypothetical protein
MLKMKRLLGPAEWLSFCLTFMGVFVVLILPISGPIWGTMALGLGLGVEAETEPESAADRRDDAKDV